MSDWLIVFLIFYGMGLPVWPMFMWDIREESEVPARYAPGEGRRREAARRHRMASAGILATPLWPFLALVLLGGVVGRAFRALNVLADEAFRGGPR